MSIKGIIKHPVVETILFTGTIISIAVILYYLMYGV